MWLSFFVWNINICVIGIKCHHQKPLVEFPVLSLILSHKKAFFYHINNILHKDMYFSAL